MHQEGLIFGASDPERAFRLDSASLQTIIIRDETTTSFQTITATSAADPNAWATKLDKMAHDVKHARKRKDQVLKKSLTMRSKTVMIGREESRSLMQSKVK